MMQLPAPLAGTSRPILITLLGLLLVGLVLGGGVVPAMLTSRRLDAEILRLEGQAKDQAQLRDLYLTLHERLQTLEGEVGAAPPPRQPLAAGHAQEIFTTLNRLSGQHRLRLEEVTPEIRSIAAGRQEIRILAVSAGEPEGLRGFLSELLALPYVEAMEEIRLEAGDTGVRLQLTFSVILS
ncbi:MAG: hypothetical protein AB1634_13070 [Thermodesulfobacteriota bacterium]